MCARSPIEAMLLRALLGDVPSDFSVHDGTRHADLRYERGLIRNPAQRLPRCATAVGAGAINAFVFADVGIATYKADILLLLDHDNGDHSLVVECDGHDFHDRTKQQASYDRSRDRELLRCGIRTIRFTGSEIVHSQERCADEVFRTLRVLNASIDAISEAAFREECAARSLVPDAIDGVMSGSIG